MFSLFGYEVLRAENGEKAWAKLQANEIDVVLTDVRMPVARRARAGQTHPRPRSLPPGGDDDPAATPDHMPENLYDAGANGFLSKPFGASGVRDAFVQASVPPDRRWSQARSGGSHVVLDRTEPDFESPGRLTLGTGGMFWSLTEAPPRVGQLVDFSIVGKSGEWKGQGIVRWTPRGDGRGPACLRDRVPVSLRIPAGPRSFAGSKPNLTRLSSRGVDRPSPCETPPSTSLAHRPELPVD